MAVVSARRSKNKSIKTKLTLLNVFILASISGMQTGFAQEKDVEFNTDVLDVTDRANYDLSRFSQDNYIYPGVYKMTLYLNDTSLGEENVRFLPRESDPNETDACITPDIVKQLNLKESETKKLTWWNDNQCLKPESLPGINSRGDLSEMRLYLNVPQAYLEYVAPDWDPPSRWDIGVTGALFDYNLSAQASRSRSGSMRQTYGNGTVGFNSGAWRFRADWQGSATSGTTSSRKDFDWNRYYAYRPLPSIQSVVTVGEDYLGSTLFDTFRFVGAALNSDDNQLPPNLRGYAPEISGIAKTNARVVVSQQGRIIYQTQVAQGPFRIQDIDQGLTGVLDVRVEEQDGTVQNFQVNISSIPYLTRPGYVRYKVAAGKASEVNLRSKGPNFVTGEASVGVNNGWSLFGGAIGSSKYQAATVGIGRDLLFLGAASFDVTRSRAQMKSGETYNGSSYRLSYSKSFDQYNSQITFAGYRFSERNYMSMPQFIEGVNSGVRAGSNRELYTVTMNKQFIDSRVSAYLNYSHQSYWNRPTNEQWNLSLARYFDLGKFKNMSATLSLFRNTSEGRKNDGGFLQISVPWSSGGSVSYNASVANGRLSQQASYSNMQDERTYYSIGAGHSRYGENFNGNINRLEDFGTIDGNFSIQPAQTSSVGISLRGGMTATAQGAALHRSAVMGGTRLMIDTDGVANVPLHGNGSPTRSNIFGKAVIADINGYYRSTASIDVGHLPDNMEAGDSMTVLTLTEGAIGYRRMKVLAGAKSMALVRLNDGSTPPFGAAVHNDNDQETGIFNDGGSVFLSGIRPNGKMRVSWGENKGCSFTLPSTLPAEMMSQTLQLLCIAETTHPARHKPSAKVEKK